MAIVKKNLISIICGVIALGAIIASFMPLGTQVQTVQADLDKAKQTHEQIQGEINKQRKMPVVDPTKTEADDLPVFPSQPIIDQGKKIVAEMQKESTAMRDAAVAMNKHALLVPQSLPLPPNQGVQFDFRIKYTDLMSVPGPGQLPKLVAPMKAGLPPTVEELTKRKQEIADKITKERVILVNGQPTPQTQQQATQEIADAQQKLPDQMRMAVAQKSLVYVNPDAFDTYPNIAGATAPDPVNIYAAQLMLWVQQDVIAAVSECNKNSANVTVAPVKRLIKVQVDPTFVRDAAVPTSGDADAPITKAPAVSPTGRVSNPLYDVVRFTMTADMDATQVQKFARDLSRNRLINAYGINISVVDSASSLSAGYAYGTAPIVNVQLECEALFMRSWAVHLMPPLVKQSLGIPEEAAPGTPAAPAEGQQPAASAR
jgi:hypothetical protein